MSAISQADALAAIHQLQNDPVTGQRMGELLEELRQFAAEHSDATLRDQFAMATLPCYANTHTFAKTAEYSYMTADAMLKAREQ